MDGVERHGPQPVRSAGGWRRALAPLVLVFGEVEPQQPVGPVDQGDALGGGAIGHGCLYLKTRIHLDRKNSAAV
jgi:hypothetical protein